MENPESNKVECSTIDSFKPSELQNLHTANLYPDLKHKLTLIILIRLFERYCDCWEMNVITYFRIRDFDIQILLDILKPQEKIAFLNEIKNVCYGDWAQDCGVLFDESIATSEFVEIKWETIRIKDSILQKLIQTNCPKFQSFIASQAQQIWDVINL